MTRPPTNGPLRCLTTMVGPHRVAIPISSVWGVREGVELVALPRSPKHVLGIVEMWGRWMGLADLRSAFGLQSAHDETAQAVAIVTEQANAHRRWLDAIEASLRDGKMPKADAAWCHLDERITGLLHDNPRIRMLLDQLRVDHEALHVAVSTALQHPASATRRLAQARRRELPRLEVLFQRLEIMLGFARRNVAVAIQSGDTHIAVCVDSVQRVEPADPMDDPKGEVVKMADDSLAVLLNVDDVLSMAPEHLDPVR